MFGYIRPQTDELRIREYKYYKAAYCGLCKSMEKTVSPVLSLSLGYEYVLLVLVRMLLGGRMGEITVRRCLANPLHKRPAFRDNDDLRYAARCSALLLYETVLDNIADETGFKRFLWRLARFPANLMRKKACSQDTESEASDGVRCLSGLDAYIHAQLSDLSALEAAGETSPDAAAQPFGTLLGMVFSFGFGECAGEKTEADRTNTETMDFNDAAVFRIANSVGMHIGRFIYLCDAVDDIMRDEKSGAYNPFVRAAQAEGLCASAYLAKYRARIENTLILECSAALRAIALSDNWETHPARPCIENVLLLGMPAVVRHILDFPGVPLSRGDPFRKNASNHIESNNQKRETNP